MKRKLISFDAFKKIEEASLINTQAELMGAEEVLAKALDLDTLELFTFGESDVTYQTTDGNYVHATYKFDKDQLVLENIEQLVIEEESEKKTARQMLSDMIESLLDNQENKASQLFESYLSMPFVRRELLVSEDFKVTVSKPTGKASPLKHKKQSRSLVAKRMRSRKKTLSRLSKSQKEQLGRKRSTAAKKLGSTSNPRWRTYVRKVKPAAMKEWANMCENVLDYLDFKEFGPVMAESFIQSDNQGNIVAVSLPNLAKRNESKILSFGHKANLDKVKVLRGKLKNKGLSEDQNFIKAMADLKRYNNISDNSALEETLEKIVSHWPDLLYVTEQELAKHIATALETANVNNYDDNTCNFMAEAILRTAHHAYTDRVKRIGSLAGIAHDISSECSSCEDSYKEFRTVADGFFDNIDESCTSDFKVVEDMIGALSEINKIADEIGDEATKVDSYNFIRECEAILNNEADFDLDLIEAIANYLYDIAESNLEGSSSDWDVSNTAHTTKNGDHPRTTWNANQRNAVPSNYNGDYSDPAPVADGQSVKKDLSDEMRSNAWANVANSDTWPDLNNPYVPKPFGDYKMKEKSAVDDGASDWSKFQSGDTYPGLSNPYVPKSPWDKSSYQMKSDNLVVDKGSNK